ncbi:ATP-binding protein [Streptomyces sp. MUM 178J]|uniref:ATP-binding protein n=1 Tax=Streptomyces sp. MUM 178J TaxID=2791991 RepID=UPI001F045DC1|nr:ATP-binding protein [Streptomyces sp. MUM 178J]WRQ81210.1 ATP-binding protein [Streptomyces sp. MUM 178J]
MDNDSFREDAGGGLPRAPRDAAAPDLGPSGAASPARTVQLVSGDFLLTVNPVDGSEIEPCPPGERPDRPERHSPAERAELRRAAQPPVPPGPAAPRLPLLERDEKRGQLVRLLGRGRSIRLTGPVGSGRTTLLNVVAEECTDLAPDGVIRLNGLGRTPAELLYDLFAAVFRAPRHRPERDELLTYAAEIGAIVVLDDLEFGGATLDELLDAAPECAFLFAAAPDVAAPASDSHIEEMVLTGLGRSSSLELLERAVDRPLTEDETNWAGDLWFESEGLPLRFVQAGALLRQCDSLRADPEAVEDASPFESVGAIEVPLPTLGEGAAPAGRLASRMSASAREALRFAVALGDEVPHQAHLPALVGDTHADAALGELMSCGLLSAVGGRYRLAPGVAAQLTEKGYADDATAHAHTAAQHYAWWAGHPSVSPERAAGEADAMLAALRALVPSEEAGHASAAVLLARSAAPAFAAGMQWGVWEKTLRLGSEAARIAGEVAEDAYFHHELGVLALCNGNVDRARAELEASIGMRGALADKSGTVAGRRALALVSDQARGDSGAVAPPLTVGDDRSAAPRPPYDSSEAPTAGLPAIVSQTFSTSDRKPASASAPGPYPGSVRPVLPPGGAASRGSLDDEPMTVMTSRLAPLAGLKDRLSSGVSGASRLSLLSGARRNLVAVGAGALLAAVLGTVVTLGATSEQENPPGEKVRQGQSANEDDTDTGLDADVPVADTPSTLDAPSDAPSSSSSDETTPSPGSSSSAPAAGGGSTPTTGQSQPGQNPTTPGQPSRTPTQTTPGTGSPSSPTPKPSPTDSGGSPTPTPTQTQTSPTPDPPPTGTEDSGGDPGDGGGSGTDTTASAPHATPTTATSSAASGSADSPAETGSEPSSGSPSGSGSGSPVI